MTVIFVLLHTNEKFCYSSLIASISIFGGSRWLSRSLEIMVVNIMRGNVLIQTSFICRIATIGYTHTEQLVYMRFSFHLYFSIIKWSEAYNKCCRGTLLLIHINIWGKCGRTNEVRMRGHLFSVFNMSNSKKWMMFRWLINNINASSTSAAEIAMWLKEDTSYCQSKFTYLWTG